MVENGYGHGCGHNLLAAATVGAALGMKAEMEERKLSGTVVFYGCPAEEVLTGKPFMARGGCFRDLELALAWHPGRSTGHRLPGPVDAAESGFTIRAFPLMRRLIPGMEEALWMRSLC